MASQAYTRIQQMLQAGQNPFGKMDIRTMTDPMGRLNPGAITDPYFQSQLELGNVDDSGQGTYNPRGGAWTDRQGRRVRQLGDGANGGYGGFAAGDVIDPNGIRFDEDLGYVTDWDNFTENPDDLGGFGTLVKGVIGAGLGYGLAGATGLLGESGGFVPETYGMAEGYGLGTGPGMAESLGYGSGLGGGGAAELASVGETGGTMLGGGSPVAAGSTGLLGSLGSGASGLLQGALSNPLQAFGLATTLSGLLGGGGGSKPPGGPSGGSGEGKGGSGQGAPVSRGTFNANPTTNRQIMQHQWVQPRSYR